MRPFANEVELRVGDTVYWDDRTGWSGTVTAIHDDQMIAVKYDNGQQDARIDRALFTTRAR
jgi:plastocyanin